MKDDEIQNGAIFEGKPAHKPNAPVPDRHDGAPCTNCGVSEIVWDGGAAECTYCGYQWK